MPSFPSNGMMRVEGTSRARCTDGRANPEGRLKAAIDAFEISLVRPVVSGDFAGWLEDIERAWSEAATELRIHIHELHPEQFRVIGKQDPELLPRVDLLKAEDEAIKEQMAKLDQTVLRFSQHGPKLEPDEQKAYQRAQGMVDEATTLIARVRKQSVAVQTWYIEAFNRDVGSVD